MSSAVTVLEGARKTRVPGGRTIEEIEADFRKPGNTMFSKVFGFDPFDYWVGPFYVGLWGFISIVGIIIGSAFYLNETVLKGPYSIPQNFFAGRLDPPPAEIGLHLASPGAPGFAWQMTVLFASIAFIGWMLREVDISMKLDMGYHVPISFSVVIFAWLTLQVIRPILVGSWSEGFTLGVMPHLDWVSNFGYRYNNFYYNPFHALGISGLFFTTFLLAAHGSAILSGSQSRDPEVVETINTFWRDIQFYSIGEAGIHRLGAVSAAVTIFVSALCILFSGWPVEDWVSFWNFWNTFPFWSGV
jgi:photosynthetic reaction center L subunit